MENRGEFFNKLIEIAHNNHGKNYQLVLVPEEISMQVISYCSMRDDLKSVLKYLEKLKEPSDMTMESALTYAVISLYGRCFTSSKEYSQLNVKTVFAKKPLHLENHIYLRNLRDHFIAHRRKTNNELGVAFFAISKANPKKATMKYQQIKLANWSSDRIDELSTTVNFVLKHIELKLEKSGFRLCKDMIEKYSYDDMQKFTINKFFE